MAVKVRGPHGVQRMKWDDQGVCHAVAELIADEKSDIKADMHVIGLPDGAVIEFGSNVITTAGDIGMIKSTGEWNWVGEEES